MQTREIFWELRELYYEKFGENYGIGVVADGLSLEDHIKRMEDALKTGVPADPPPYEGDLDLD